jgi:hypothetical protein
VSGLSLERGAWRRTKYVRFIGIGARLPRSPIPANYARFIVVRVFRMPFSPGAGHGISNDEQTLSKSIVSGVLWLAKYARFVGTASSGRAESPGAIGLCSSRCKYVRFVGTRAVTGYRATVAGRSMSGSSVRTMAREAHDRGTFGMIVAKYVRFIGRVSTPWL